MKLNMTAVLVSVGLTALIIVPVSARERSVTPPTSAVIAESQNDMRAGLQDLQAAAAGTGGLAAVNAGIQAMKAAHPIYDGAREDAIKAAKEASKVGATNPSAAEQYLQSAIAYAQRALAEYPGQ